jgi:CheY-like chemotaxis protein
MRFCLVHVGQLGASILLVEDDADIAETLSELLLDEGYAVTVATNAKQALSLLSAGLRPALMVVDLGMPEMNGVEFLRICNESPDLARTPSILMSAFGPRDRATAGVGIYLQKPFSPEQLIESVSRLLSPP